ncbi:hypothetical protein C3495_01935 [Clostridiaceae bacterium 14S0207]|nr:hypothetical protein C3495_01935 [Clostridiaceae bacterium 14S0207]
MYKSIIQDNNKTYIEESNSYISFKRYIKKSLQKALECEDTKQALYSFSEAISKYYENKQVYYTKKYGKREEYKAGYGEDTFTPVEKGDLTLGYSLFFQGFIFKNNCEKQLIISCSIVIINLMDI